MTSNTHEDPPRAAHHDILEKEQTRTYHVVYFLPECRHIMDIARASIDIGYFSEGTRAIVDVILPEALITLQYMRLRRNRGQIYS